MRWPVYNFEVHLTLMGARSMDQGTLDTICANGKHRDACMFAQRLNK